MNYVCIGKVVGTHGIKGEFRILSDFEYKERVFIPGNIIYIGNSKKELKILTHRMHKNYNMIMVEGYNNINQVLMFKRQDVFVTRESLNLLNNEYLEYDLIGLDALCNQRLLGKVTNVYNTGKEYKVIEIGNESETRLIPYHKDFIDEINIDNKYIKFNKEGVINEN